MLYRLISLVIIFILGIETVAAQTPIYSASVRHHPIVGENGMVASQHKLATEVGLEILKQGGNAVDAAVAVGFSLAVVLPRAGNLGGGGFMITYNAESEATETINYREMAPKNASRDMYLNADGSVNNAKFNASYHSVGVPGTVAGLASALA